MRIDWVRFGASIQEDMDRLGLTQDEYVELIYRAQGVKIAQSLLSQLMRGKIKKPGYVDIQALKRQLHLRHLPGEPSVPDNEVLRALPEKKTPGM